MFKRFLFVTLFIICSLCASAQLSTDEKVTDLLSRLTLDEKIAIIHASTQFSNGAVPRLGIPALRMSDGPCGVRQEINPHDWGSPNWKNDDGIYLTAFTGVASTWNTALAQETGEILGQETKIRGKHIQLAPGINILRTPLNGRNWEYMSEDPYLISQMAVPLIQGIQSNGVAACVKHYALNNQETWRGFVNVEVDERALREIYLPGFESSVEEGGSLTIMGAYNKFRGQHATYNKYLIQDILKGEWGFKGAVISDWNAAHNTVEAGLYGLDIEMGTNVLFDDYYMGKPMLEAVRKGLVSESMINEKVRRVLYVIVKLNALNELPFDTTGMKARLATPERCMKTRKVAEEAIVLLKNEKNILPLDLNSVKSICIIGDNADRKHALGGGSTTIKARYEITPLEGLKQFTRGKIKFTVVPGYKAPVLNRHGQDRSLDSVKNNLIKEAVEAAAKSDYVIIFGGLNHNFFLEAEGGDRANMTLPYGQDKLIEAVVKANPHTIVVLLSGSPVEMGRWLDKVPALLQHSYLGMEGGNAIAEVLFGNVNPSGKLPYTFPKKLSDSPAIKLGEYPGKDSTVHYNEGLYVGYRYFDTKKVEPLFPFGFGLSYTQFTYSNLQLPKIINSQSDTIIVTFDVTNTGKRDGMEVAQCYVHDLECSLDRPLKELKGFEKVMIKAGETKNFSLTLRKNAFQFYDPSKKAWVSEPGKFEILVGSSSRDIRLTGDIMMK